METPVPPQKEMTFTAMLKAHPGINSLGVCRDPCLCVSTVTETTCCCFCALGAKLCTCCGWVGTFLMGVLGFLLLYWYVAPMFSTVADVAGNIALAQARARAERAEAAAASMLQFDAKEIEQARLYLAAQKAKQSPPPPSLPPLPASNPFFTENDEDDTPTRRDL